MNILDKIKYLELLNGGSEKMERYIINFNTGAGNIEVKGTIGKAIEEANKGLAYTQRSVTIEKIDGKTVACLPWYGTEPEEYEIVTEQFGSYGYYGEWVIEDNWLYD